MDIIALAVAAVLVSAIGLLLYCHIAAAKTRRLECLRLASHGREIWDTKITIDRAEKLYHFVEKGKAKP